MCGNVLAKLQARRTVRKRPCGHSPAVSNATKWPERETDGSITRVQLATTQKLARYWATEYDWRKCEARLSALPQFITEIDGLDIHFIHVRSKHEGALPLIVTHGWPGSVVEQLKIVDPLTNPTAHGGSASDAFDVVIPSMPGYGYSGKPTETGWGRARIARAWDALTEAPRLRSAMWRRAATGARSSSTLMGVQAPQGLLGIHTNMAWRLSRRDQRGGLFRARPRLRVSPRTRRSRTNVCSSSIRRASPTGYQLGLRPQTLCGIADSPVGLAAYFLDHDAAQLCSSSRASSTDSPRA